MIGEKKLAREEESIYKNRLTTDLDVEIIG